MKYSITNTFRVTRDYQTIKENITSKEEALELVNTLNKEAENLEAEFARKQGKKVETSDVPF